MRKSYRIRIGEVPRDLSTVTMRVDSPPPVWRKLLSLLRSEPNVAAGLSWRRIGLTLLVGVLLAMTSELIEGEWVQDGRYGLPTQLLPWLLQDYSWLVLFAITGLNILLLEALFGSLSRSRLGSAYGLASAVVASSLLSCAILFAWGSRAIFLLWGGTLGFRAVPYELFALLVAWGFAAATYYIVEHAHLITWKALAIVFAFCLLNYARGIANGTEADDERVLSALREGLVGLPGALPIVVGVIATFNRFPVSGRRQNLALALVVVLSTAIGAVLSIGIASKGTFVGGDDLGPVSFPSYFRNHLGRFGVLGALFAIAYAYYRNESSAALTLRKAEQDQATLDAQAVEARLQVLQAQIEPHFLFNTLAHVKRLYQTDPEGARDMLDNLMRYLEVTLPQMRANDSTIEREATMAKAYLDIQGIRMGRRLRFEICLPEALRGARLPPMMLLTLVENAVKHGLSPLPEGGFIQIAAETDAGSLHVNVADSGRGFTRTFGAGGGLANIRARLAALYGSSGRLSLRANVPRGVTASIAVPLEMTTADSRSP